MRSSSRLNDLGRLHENNLSFTASNTTYVIPTMSDNGAHDPSKARDSDAYYDLGTYTRSVTTYSSDAKLWFDRGLRWAYSFNHEEAVRCFERSAEHDPNCAMAYWGIAYAAGPNYNKAWIRYDRADLEVQIAKSTAALARALHIAASATPLERALITALTHRFPPVGNIPSDLKDFGTLDRAYAQAMRPVYQDYNDDLDVVALFAEALMCISPRALWNLDTGKPSGEGTVEARAAIEAAMDTTAGREHPALCHLYIHLMEMSPYPEVALPAADRLRYLVPEGSHMSHMATHIDIACGDYRHAVDSNRHANAVDDRFFARENHCIQYTMYRAHNVYARVYSAIISGRSAEAISAAKHLYDIITPELMAITSPPMADWTEGLLGALPHALVRFGRWEAILDLKLPIDQSVFCSTTAIIHYARGIALGVLGRLNEAETAQANFERVRATVPYSRLSNLPCRVVEVLEVASAVLDGELEYRRSNYDAAFVSLRKAVKLEDGLPYSDPPPWMQPARHALGALLLEQNHVQEAEVVFREDLGLSESLPRRKARINNVWGLHGLYECLIRSGKHEDARLLRLQRDIAMASADVQISTSCFCRLSAFEPSASCCSTSTTKPLTVG